MLHAAPGTDVPSAATGSAAGCVEQPAPSPGTRQAQGGNRRVPTSPHLSQRRPPERLRQATPSDDGAARRDQLRRDRARRRSRPASLCPDRHALRSSFVGKRRNAHCHAGLTGGDAPLRSDAPEGSLRTGGVAAGEANDTSLRRPASEARPANMGSDAIGAADSPKARFATFTHRWNVRTGPARCP